MKNFGEQASAFRDAYDAWSELEDLRLSQPELTDMAEEGQRNTVERRMALESAAVADFESALIPSVDTATEKLRTEIENLRATKAYQNKFITEEAIQAKLNALPRPESYAEEDIRFATAYWIARLLLHTNYSLEQTMPQVQSIPEATGAESEEQASDNEPNKAVRTIVELPNGKTLSGRTADLYILLVDSTKEAPVTEELFRSAGIYSDFELSRLRHGSFALSTLVSTLRSRLKHHGLEDSLSIRAQEIDKASRPAGTASKTAYYLERAELLEVTSTPANEPVQPARIETRPDKLPEFPIHDAAVLAEYINMRAPLLRQMGLQPLDNYIIAKFDENLPEVIEAPSHADLELQRARTYAFIHEHLSPASINTFLDELGPDDPRSDLLIYVHNMVEANESRVRFERALRAQIISVFREETSRRGMQSSLEAIRYRFDDGTPPIEIPYDYIESGIVAPAPDLILRLPDEDETAGEPAMPLVRRHTRLPKAFPELAPTTTDNEHVNTGQSTESTPTVPATTATDKVSQPEVTETKGNENVQWEKEFKQKIGGVIDQLKYDGLMPEGRITPKVVRLKSSSASLGTETNLDRLTAAGILAKNRNIRLSAADIVAMALINTSAQILGKNQPSQRRALELIQECVASFFEHRKQAD